MSFSNTNHFGFSLGAFPWRSALLRSSLSLALVASTLSAQAFDGEFGTVLRPFAKDSPWNSKPVNPRFGSFVIPPSDYVPAIAEGSWSTGVFEAALSDPPVTVQGLPNTKGLWHPDAETYGAVTVPRWPAGVVPAPGADGHAEIVDPESGIVHSFWKLRQHNDGWVAAQYAWSWIDGRGWGDPAHYFQGARAAAVPTMAGLIRKHEVNDGQSMYHHALAMSLTYNGLATAPAYVFPATSADRDAAQRNSGSIPQGALLMLPPSFNTQTIRTPAVRKVAETLKEYGAYVVDRNHGTPYVIYVETGSGFNLHRGGWNSVAAADLERIRAGLRQVVGADGWMDGEGSQFDREERLNLLSMRGTWTVPKSGRAGVFDSWRQAVVFPPGSGRVEQTNASGRNMHRVIWALPEPGASYQVRAYTSGGGLFRLRLVNVSGGGTVFDSGPLADGQTANFTWPPGEIRPVLHAISGEAGESSVAGELLRVD
jgi:hypothetical protein